MIYSFLLIQKICYLIFIISLLLTGYMIEINKIYFIFVIFIFVQMFFFQLNKLKIKDADSCFSAFKSNNFLGLLVFVSILIGKIL